MKKLGLIVAAMALFATACGGGGPSNEQADAATAAGEANEAQLALAHDLAASEVLDAADGSITTLSDVITGDRPVLLWYWAPH